MSDPQWEALQRAWQEPPDARLPRLERLLTKRSRVIWALTALDAVGTVLLILGLRWVMRQDSTSSEIGWSVFLVVVLAAVWGAVLLIRRGTWRSDVEAPAAMVALSIRRCRASIRLALLNQSALLIMLALATTLRAAGIAAPRMGFEVTPSIRIVAASFILGVFAVAEWYKRRKRRELGRLEDLAKDLGRASS